LRELLVRPPVVFALALIAGVSVWLGYRFGFWLGHN